ncbi:unnamed protein product [Camellia sinensis]
MSLFGLGTKGHFARKKVHLQGVSMKFTILGVIPSVIKVLGCYTTNLKQLWYSTIVSKDYRNIQWHTGAQLRQHIDATLGSGNLREAVRLPPGEDANEWLAVNMGWYDMVLSMFSHVVLDNGSLFADTGAVDFFNQIKLYRYEYRWADGVQIKKPIEVSAPKYVEYLMDWIESQLDDESIFPQRLGAPFPPNFREVVKTIFKRLFRVYAHIYHSHFQKIEFGLIDKKELAPLQELVESIVVPY